MLFDTFDVGFNDFGRDVRVVGSVEETVRRGKGQQRADGLFRRRTRQVKIEAVEVGIEVNLAHQAVLSHHRIE